MESVIAKNPHVKRQYLLIIVDALLIVASILFAYYFGLNFRASALYDYLFDIGIYIPIFVALVVHIILFYIFDLYTTKDVSLASGRLVRIALAVGIAVLILAFYSYFFEKEKMMRRALIIHIPLIILFIYLWREIFYFFLLDLAKKQRKLNLLIIGIDALNLLLLEEMAEPMHSDDLNEYRVASIFRGGEAVEVPQAYKSLLTEEENLGSVVNKKEIDIVVFSMDSLRKFNHDLLYLKSVGIQVFDTMTFYKLITGRVPIVSIEDSTVSCLAGRFPISTYYRNVKRLIDVILSSIGLIFSLPFVIIAAILVQFESRGPIFFRPHRVGENGRTLKLLKLRTMTPQKKGEEGPLLTQENDKRVTMIGGLIRKFGFDEFPQLINVLQGDLSLIGPRPIEKVFIDSYAQKTPLYYLRTSVKPGISGWAQVNQVEYPNSERTQLVKLEYDLFYISHASLFLDLIIVLKTVKKFFNLGYDNRGKKNVRLAAGKVQSADGDSSEGVAR